MFIFSFMVINKACQGVCCSRRIIRFLELFPKFNFSICYTEVDSSRNCTSANPERERAQAAPEERAELRDFQKTAVANKLILHYFVQGQRKTALLSELIK